MAQITRKTPERRRPSIRFLVICLLIASASYGAWRYVQARDADLHAQTGRPAPPAAPVQVAKAARTKVPIYAVGLGAVQAYNTVTIRSRVDGEIQKIGFQEGQMVKAGDLLVQIDPRPFQAALDQTIAKKAQDEAQLANARLDLARYSDLASRGNATRQQLDTQQAMVNSLIAQVQSDQSQIENARTQLSYTTIRSPLEGRTGLRLVDEGNIVRSTEPNGIVTIAQLHPIAALFALPERYLPSVQKAFASGPVPVTALGQDGKSEIAHGTLSLIDNQVDQATGTIKLKATFENTDNALWPGEFMSARVLLESLDALAVPADAVQRSQQGLSVYVVKDDNTVDFRKVDIGPITQGVAVVESGVAEGERVVIAGHYRLRPGAKVQISSEPQDQTTTAATEPVKPGTAKD